MLLDGSDRMIQHATASGTFLSNWKQLPMQLRAIVTA